MGFFPIVKAHFLFYQLCLLIAGTILGEPYRPLNRHVNILKRLMLDRLFPLQSDHLIHHTEGKPNIYSNEAHDMQAD